MEEMTVKFKRVDTGKYWIGGNVKEGKYGPQIGMKKTAELMAYLDSVAINGWINFSLDKPYDKKPLAKAQELDDLSDSIPF